VSNYTTHSVIHYVIRNFCPSPKYRRGYPAGYPKLLQLETPLWITPNDFRIINLSLYTISITGATVYKTLYDTRRVL